MGGHFVDRVPFAKIATILAISAGVSLGLCGIGFAMSDGGNKPGMLSTLTLGIGEFGLIIFWISVLGLIITFVVWVIASIVHQLIR